MASTNDTVSTDLIRQGIELYTGRTVDEVRRHPDPQVAGAMALRATFVGDVDYLDFLIGADARALRTPEDVEAELEECDFGSWPPRSGSPRFF